ncbi:MAG: phosphoglucosamine mutase [Candidatus Diapherotrites archaeon]
MEKKLFGTDGIRGVANVHPMTAEMAVQIGKAIAEVFANGNGKKTKVVIGKDTRLSGYMLETALTSGLVSMGADVLLVGPMPTPGVAHLTKSLNADAGIVLSASHNPANDNGIKIFGSDGYKLSDDVEMKIEKKVLDENISSDHIQGELVGKAYRVNEAKGRYIEYVKASVNNRPLNSLTVVLDCANGAAYSIAPRILEELGAEVIVQANQPNGLNINFRCGATYPELIQKTVKQYKADIGLALDGDGDRLIVCDEKGKIVDGDHIMAICAAEMKRKKTLAKDTVVGTQMTNIGFDKAMEEKGIKVVKTAVGDRYVIEEMRKEGYSFGGEQSGHIIFGHHSTTGDGIITALHLLEIMGESGKKLSALASFMESFPQILVNVRVKEKRDFSKMKNVQKKVAEVEKKLKSNGRLLLRYSGTENLARVMIEGKDQKEITSMANEIAAEIKKEVGE